MNQGFGSFDPAGDDTIDRGTFCRPNYVEDAMLSRIDSSRQAQRAAMGCVAGRPAVVEALFGPRFISESTRSRDYYRDVEALKEYILILEKERNDLRGELMRVPDAQASMEALRSIKDILHGFPNLKD